MKTAALLELTGKDASFDDTDVRDTLVYIQEIIGYSFPIFDTRSSSLRTRELLDQLYQQGYRIFIGFNRSTMLESVADWFVSHPDAIGISLLSTAPSLSYLKNVIRLSPVGSTTNGPYIDWMRRYQQVYIIYQKGEIAVEESIRHIGKYATHIIPYDPRSIKSVLTQIRDRSRNASSLIIPYLVSTLPEFIRIAEPYVDDTPINILEDISSEVPDLDGSTAYQGRYFFMQPRYIPSPINNLIRTELGDRYSRYGYDAVVLAQALSSGMSINDIPEKKPPIYDIKLYRSSGWIRVDTIIGRV